MLGLEGEGDEREAPNSGAYIHITVSSFHIISYIFTSLSPSPLSPPASPYLSVWCVCLSLSYVLCPHQRIIINGSLLKRTLKVVAVNGASGSALRPLGMCDSYANSWMKCSAMMTQRFIMRNMSNQLKVS